MDIATIAASTIDRYHYGSYLYFEVPALSLWVGIDYFQLDRGLQDGLIVPPEEIYFSPGGSGFIF